MDIHFNVYKVRYELLNTFLKPVLSSRKITTANVFINLDDMFRSLHKPIINNEFQMSGVNASKQLISNILNLIGHYKYWFTKYNGINCKFYATYTSSFMGFKNSNYVSKYRKHYSDINSLNNGLFFFINDAIKGALEFLPIINNYLEDVFLIDSKHVEPSAIPLYLANNTPATDWNFVISKDIYDMQYSYMDKWTMILPKGDFSQIIDRGNLWNYIADKEKIIDLENISLYEPELFPTILALVGDKYRNIKRIKRIGWKTVFKYLNKVYLASIDKSLLTIKLLLLTEIHGKNVKLEDINNNIAATNIIDQVNDMGEIDTGYIGYQLSGVPDYDNLLQLNNLYFSKYPINLTFLTAQTNKVNNKQVNWTNS